MFEAMTATFLDYFGAEQFMDGPGLAKLVLRLLIDLVFATIVIRMIYVRRYGWNDHVFTYFAFNVILILVWLALSVRIVREHAQLSDALPEQGGE